MNIIYFKELDSTNTYAKQNIKEITNKTIISADFQTNGYGRFKRTWVDVGAENIYMTFVLKPSNELKEVHACLTQYLSVCLCKQLEEIGINPLIKWPNDVLINNKKVCGILAESVIKGGKLEGIVIGIGINLNSSQKILQEIDRPATSLNIELGHAIDKEKFIKKLVELFFKDYETFLQNEFDFIKKDYEQYSLLKTEEKIKVAIFNKLTEGEFSGFDQNGNLLLRNNENTIQNINMGEIVE